jgi:peptidoglycan/xylan/chitin deacetylase (PgdA/CDA1 family)
VLEVLDRCNLKATFFVIGDQLRDPAAARLLDKVGEAGHGIGNHTLSHSVAFGDRPDERFARDEIEDAQALIGHWGDREKLFRPYGKYGLLGNHLFSASALSHLRRNGYTTVIWNTVPGDWKNVSGWDKDCIDMLNKTDWPVVVLHDIADACLARLPIFLRRIVDLGYSVEPDFPESVIITRGGRYVTATGALVADGLPR